MSSHPAREILVADQYDDDASSAESLGWQDSEFKGHRNEPRSHDRPNDKDRSVLRDEEEQQKLLSRSGRLDELRESWRSRREDGIAVKISKREARRRRRKNGKAARRNENRRSEDGELMFEMEEGVKDLSSQSSSYSLDLDRQKWAAEETKYNKPTRRRFVFAHILILAIFTLLGFGAYKASSSPRKHPLTKGQQFSNGTHLFGPTTILISLDGFRADFLNRDLTPALNAFIASGVSPRYMLPSFPSVTFPNHFTLVTGLYPESHGLVGNQFWDPELQEEFYYTDPARSLQPKWWKAEPLWVTAEHQGVRSAIHMWPGSEAHIPDIEPTYLDKFNESESLIRKVDRILNWLDLPGTEDASATNLRPQLIAAYVPNVDTDGHLYGPNSTEIRGTIADVDSMLTLLVEGLLVRNLTEIINVVIVSDHGMATTSTSRMIQLDDIIDLSLVDHIDGWPLRGLRLKNPDRDVPILYEQLMAESKKSDGFDVYTLETMPARYHFSNNPRIAPLWIVPKTGWAIVERAYFDVLEAQATGKIFHPIGLHGYDHEHPLMRAIFIARGPAFPHPPNSRVPVFQNTEVYNIICDSLGITPHPNNGTLRLPLTTVGLHSDEDAPLLETPHDPEPSEPPDASGSSEPEGPGESSSNDTGPDFALPSGDKEEEKPEPPPEEHKGKEASKTSWWDFIHDGLEKAKEWANELVESLKGNKHNDNGDKPQMLAD